MDIPAKLNPTIITSVILEKIKSLSNIQKQIMLRPADNYFKLSAGLHLSKQSENINPDKSRSRYLFQGPLVTQVKSQ